MPGICVTNKKRSRFVLFAQISTPQSGCGSPVAGSLRLAYCLALFQREGGEGGGAGEQVLTQEHYPQTERPSLALHLCKNFYLGCIPHTSSTWYV